MGRRVKCIRQYPSNPLDGAKLARDAEWGQIEFEFEGASAARSWMGRFIWAMKKRDLWPEYYTRIDVNRVTVSWSGKRPMCVGYFPLPAARKSE